MMMQTWRRRELLRMLGVTSIRSHNHVGSQALGVKFALLKCTCCGSSFQMVSKLTFDSLVVLCFGWSLWYFSSMALQMWESNRFKSGELKSHWVFSMNRFTFSHFCMMLEHWEMGVLWLKQHNIVIFQFKLGGKVYIWLFNSHLKF